MSLAAGVWLLLGIIWGSSWLFIKVGLDHLPPFTFAGIRFAIAIIPLSILAVMRRARWPLGLRDWAFMAVTGVITFALTYGLVFWGEQYISSGLAALLFSTFPLFGLLIAHWYLAAERMTIPKVVGVLLGIVGIGIVFSNEFASAGPLALWGSAAIVLAALAAAYADVLIKLRAGHFDPVVLTLVQMIAGTIPLLIIGITVEGDPRRLTWTPLAIMSLVYLALVGSALAFVLLYWLIKHMDVTKTMLITLVTPLIAILLGIVVLGEALLWRTAIGGGAILAGLALTLRRREIPLLLARKDHPVQAAATLPGADSHPPVDGAEGSRAD